MPSLKDLKIRIGSVKNTQKITKAMKMVAAAKLRRAKEQAEAARPYSDALETMLQSLVETLETREGLPELLVGTGRDDNYLLVVATADKGLCGGFNSSIVKETKLQIAKLEAQGKKVHLFCLGKKGYEQLEHKYQSNIVARVQELYKNRPDYAHAEQVRKRVQELIAEHKIDKCFIIYNRFQTAISQHVYVQQLVPMPVGSDPLSDVLGNAASSCIFEPQQDVILEDLVPRNLTVQIYRAMLENSASEQGARMTAMDNATRNAGDMIKRLTLQYNRTRQAAITKELIEIISGAEALN
jgi:F-type H+-transporting ATPase subunit gamma